jgi:DNA-binding XRE family transcriptional regulator
MKLRHPESHAWVNDPRNIDQYTVDRPQLGPVNYIMLDVNEQQRYLSELGIRLKRLRLARNDTMAVFAQRLGVSAGTLRAMEHGTATVQIGAWVKALWVLDHLDDLDCLLAQKESLLDLARAPRKRSRQRASRRAG